MTQVLKPIIFKNRYILQKKIKEGEFYTIYKVREKESDKELILKESAEKSLISDKASEIPSIFEREYRILLTLIPLKSPHFPRVYDFFEENNRILLVMDYIKGIPLSSILGKPLSVEETLNYGEQILKILIQLHSRGIIYGDLKPDNILTGEEGILKIFDFTTARFYSPDPTSPPLHPGTPGYTPPEQYNDKQADEGADIFAWGAILHYMLTGKNPEDNPFQFEEPHKLNPDVPEKISCMVMKCLQMNTSQRFQSSRELMNTWISYFDLEFTGYFRDTKVMAVELLTPFLGIGWLYLGIHLNSTLGQYFPLFLLSGFLLAFAGLYHINKNAVKKISIKDEGIIIQTPANEEEPNQIKESENEKNLPKRANENESLSSSTPSSSSSSPPSSFPLLPRPLAIPWTDVKKVIIRYIRNKPYIIFNTKQGKLEIEEIPLPQRVITLLESKQLNIIYERQPGE